MKFQLVTPYRVSLIILKSSSQSRTAGYRSGCYGKRSALCGMTEVVIVCLCKRCSTVHVRSQFLLVVCVSVAQRFMSAVSCYCLSV